MTYGEMAVGLNFNPSGDDDVTRAKKLFAEVIDLCDQLRAASRPHSEKERLFGIAITEAQTAQMWVVKAITFKERDDDVSND